MSVAFYNGPIQNGDFTFSERPGKAVGIWIADALNALAGTPRTPHLWNTATLAGDLRHQRHRHGDTISREQREAHLIAAKYAPGDPPESGTLTDADPAVAAVALDMIARHLEAGTLALRSVAVRVCAACGHMTGDGPYSCRACGYHRTVPHTARHLVADRTPGQPVLTRDDFHAHRSRPPTHLMDVAGNAPARLILSRTRRHGIDLTPVGLPDLVLDARAAVHVTVLAAARRRDLGRAVTTTTQGAAANVAAYGQPFRQYDGTRLRYAIHGKVPYEGANLHRLYDVHRVTRETGERFEAWFLPLCSLRERSGIQPARLGALVKFFRRADLARPRTVDDARRADVRQAVRVGDLRWIMDIHTLPHVIPGGQTGSPPLGVTKAC